METMTKMPRVLRIAPKLNLALLVMLVGVGQASAEPGGGDRSEAAKVAATFAIIDDYGVRKPAALFGAVLKETFSPSDPDTYEANVRGALKGEQAAEAFLKFRKRPDFLRVQPSLAGIDRVSLIGIEWLSPLACGFTYLAIGDQGPVAVEVQMYSLPKEGPNEVRIASIKTHRTWEEIRAILQVQKKLPAAVSITGGFDDSDDSDDTKTSDDQSAATRDSRS